MFSRILLLLAGIVLIIKGGDLFVSASIRTAEFLNVPRLVIGSTLVSLATTSPEMVVSVVAGIQGESGLAVGNAVGSCICNIGLNIANLTLIIGVAAVISGVTMTRTTQLFNFPALLIILLLFLYAILSARRITRTEGFALLAFYGVYVAGLVGITVLTGTM